MPGDTASRCVNVTYTGPARAEVELYVASLTGSGGAGGNGLGQDLAWSATQGSGAAGGASGDCTGFTAAAGLTPSGTTAASFAASSSSFATGVGAWVAKPAGDTRSFKFTYTMVNGANAQNATASMTLRWEARTNTYAAAVMADNPVAYWRLGERAGTAAVDQTGTNPGTYQSGPALGKAGGLLGDPDTAIGLDGTNDNVRIPASASLNTTSAMTIEAWIKYPSGAAAAPIVEYNNGATYGVHFWRYPNPNDLFVNYVDTTGTGHSLTAGNTLTPGVWHYVETSYSGANARLYVDGILVAISGTWSNLTLKTNSDVYIGYRPSGPNYATMDVDDVAIYNYTLPGQGGRATLHANAGRSPYATTVLADSPVAYWRLGDLTGTSAPGLMAVNAGIYTNGPTLGKTGAIATETDTGSRVRRGQRQRHDRRNQLPRHEDGDHHGGLGRLPQFDRHRAPSSSTTPGAPRRCGCGDIPTATPST